MAVATIGFPFIRSPWLLGVQCLLAGLAVSPVLISGFALIERLIPNARMTEGLVVGQHRSRRRASPRAPRSPAG